jgi:hypothetical protein
MEYSQALRFMAVTLLAVVIFVLPVSAVELSGTGVDITAAETPLVGGDRDEHGCIGSAGYTWCEAKQKCIREWEEPCATATGTPAGVMPGSDRDEHGCIGSAGYTWCEAKQKCIREWEEPCVAAAATADENTVETVVPTTKSPLPAAIVIGALGAACLLAAVRKD